MKDQGSGVELIVIMGYIGYIDDTYSFEAISKYISWHMLKCQQFHDLHLCICLIL